MNNLEIFFSPAPNPDALFYLICFPFAGGSSTSYLPWLDHIPAEVELVVCQLPGRGVRLFETPHTSMTAMVADLCEAMAPFCDKPCVFFGHSMGAKVAYELALELNRRQLPLPVHFIASAASAPFLARRGSHIHGLSDVEFMQAVAKLNGTPAQVLANPELISLFLPALRADFKIIETYINKTKTTLATSLTLFGGTMDDSVSPSELGAWSQVFEETIDICWFTGGHFFIAQKMSNVVQALNKLLNDEIVEQCLIGG